MKELLKNFRQPACDETIYYCLNEGITEPVNDNDTSDAIIYYIDQW